MFWGLGVDYELLAAAFSMGVKLATGGMILFFAQQRHRQTSLYWGIAWFVYAYAILGDLTGKYVLGALSIALFASLLLYGFTRLAGVETSVKTFSEQISVLPVGIVAYLVLVMRTFPEDTSFAVMGTAYGISGLFMLLLGALLLKLRELYGSKARDLGASLILYGIHNMDYPFLRNVGWFAPLGFLLGLALTLLSAVFMVEFITVFPIELPKEGVKGRVEKGLFLVSPSKVGEFVETLRDYPVLAFVRSLNPPKAWRAFRITNVEGKWTISPTNLPKILEVSVGYMESLNEGEPKIRPVILLEGVEYIRLYVDFKGLAKFLSTLRDYVTLNEGTLIVVLDKNAWDERELKTLERLLT